MKDIIFATKNEGKLKEIREIFNQVNVSSMAEAGINTDVVEDGDTFEANAVKKAREISELSDKIAIADDSGLEIDYLNKEPGVNSARFMGKDTSYSFKNEKIIESLRDVPFEKRTARFVCVAAAAFPDGKLIVEKGVLEGFIAETPRGENGFGYDPIFYVREYNMTTAEMPIELKNRISHRGQAFQKLKESLL